MKNETYFTMESWNHPCFERKYYHMVWGPYQMSQLDFVKNNIVKNFHSDVKYVMYRHDKVRD